MSCSDKNDYTLLTDFVVDFFVLLYFARIPLGRGIISLGSPDLPEQRGTPPAAPSPGKSPAGNGNFGEQPCGPIVSLH
jgi:hypothetical protein